MVKPDNWEESTPQYAGERRSEPGPGAYVCRIVKAEATTSKAGQDMLVLDLDIAEGDFDGYYQSEYDNAVSCGWEPWWKLRLFQLTGGKQTPYFKGLILNIEVSNPGYSFNFDESTLKGKLVGVVLDIEEYEYGDKVRTRLKPGRTYTAEQARRGETCQAMRIGLDRKRHKLEEVSKAAELEPVDDIDIPF